MDDWRKSSFSNANGGDCVEVASGNGVMVRDTANRAGGTLEFGTETWAEFTASLR
jgi:hypothetical protein